MGGGLEWELTSAHRYTVILKAHRWTVYKRFRTPLTPPPPPPILLLTAQRGGPEWSGFSWRTPSQHVSNLLHRISSLLTYRHHLMLPHLNILYACLIRSPVTGHVSFFIPPIIILHVIRVHTSCVLLLPPHIPKDPWKFIIGHTPVSLMTCPPHPMDTRSLKSNPCPAIDTLFTLSAHQTISSPSLIQPPTQP
jgi:hypothetical protein